MAFHEAHSPATLPLCYQQSMMACSATSHCIAFIIMPLLFFLVISLSSSEWGWGCRRPGPRLGDGCCGRMASTLGTDCKWPLNMSLLREQLSQQTSRCFVIEVGLVECSLSSLSGAEDAEALIRGWVLSQTCVLTWRARHPWCLNLNIQHRLQLTLAERSGPSVWLHLGPLCDFPMCCRICSIRSQNWIVAIMYICLCGLCRDVRACQRQQSVYSDKQSCAL